MVKQIAMSGWTEAQFLTEITQVREAQDQEGTPSLIATPQPQLGGCRAPAVAHGLARRVRSTRSGMLLRPRRYCAYSPTA